MKEPIQRPRPTRRFAFGLLVYLLLTLFSFQFVWHYTQRIRDSFGGIRDAWLQFSIYFLIYCVLVLVLMGVLALFPIRLTPENRLRLAFLIGATLSSVFALYQARFGTGLSLAYFTVGVVGTFAPLVWATYRRFGLVEVVAAASPEVIAAVTRAHAGVPLAADVWDHIKRALELALSVALMVVSLPISVLLVMLVWLQDPGPILVAKVAVMRGGRSFQQLKLRSMVKNAEAGTGPVPAAPNDRRVTRLGGLLRRTHIDELPQMINIARGEMSLVGPRPERTVFVQSHLAAIPRYRLRHAVRPGLAGMAQVYGDYYSTPREKLHYDLLYIRERSLWLDTRLFTAAVLMALFGVAPQRRHNRRDMLRQRHERENWRRAYRALRGEAAPPDATPEAPAPPLRTAPPAATDPHRRSHIP